MLRVGIIDYVNTLPLFHALRENIISHNATFSFGPPARINKQFSKNELDIATISAAHFLEHRLDYLLLSDLGIAATHQVLSIRLFSKKKPQQLDGAKILVPAHSASSVRILKTLCKQFWKVIPFFCSYVDSAKKLFAQDDPFLVIGDECLFVYEKYPEYPSLDLAEVWHSITKKSSLYAVVATRNDAYISQPEEVIQFQKCLESSFAWSQDNKAEIIKRAAKKTGCSTGLIEKYFSVLEYQLTPKHFHGLDYLSKL